MSVNNRSESGQAIILIVFGIIGLLAMTALAIDAGNAFADRRHAQSAADTAAFAAALEKINDTPSDNGNGIDWSGAGLARATSNGYSNNGVNTVVINNPPAASCDGSNGPYVGNSQYIQTIIHSTVNTYFGAVIGIRQLHNCVEAIARVKPSVTTPLAYGSAIAALDCTGSDTILSKGSSNITLVGSGAYSNSSSSEAIFVQKMNGLITPTDKGLQAVGGISAPYGYPSAITTSLTQLPCPLPSYMLPKYTCDYTYADLPPAKPDPQGHVTYPGGVTTFSPGVYCVTGGFSKTTMANTTTGGTGIGGVTFVMLNEGFKWNGNEQIHLSAPTSGPTKGLLIYLPYGNNGPVWFNGTADSSFVGTLFAPGADVVLLGDYGTNSHGQIVGGTIDMSGNSGGTINYDAGENYSFPSPPEIELTK